MKPSPLRVARRFQATPSIGRVASRWLQAGLIQPPPKFVEAVAEWAQQRYAEHTLALLGDGDSGDPKELVQEFMGQVDALGAGETAEVSFPSGEKVKATKRDDGTFDLMLPIATLSRTDRGDVAEFTKTYAERAVMSTAATEDLRREAQKYARQAKDHGNAAGTRMKVDLTGWKYLSGSQSLVGRVNAERKELNAEINAGLAKAKAAKADKVVFLGHEPDFVPPGVVVLDSRLEYDIDSTHRTSIRDEHGEWDREFGAWVVPVAKLAQYRVSPLDSGDVLGALADRGYDEVVVELALVHPSSMGFQAQWHALSKRLTIVAEPLSLSFPEHAVSDFKERMQSIEDMAHHESIHMAQDLLTDLKGAYAGVPSKRHEPQKVDWNAGDYFTSRRVHRLSPKEFYTVLNDKVREFRRRNPNPSAQDVRRYLQNERDFFAILKREAPKRWQKAVSEFTKAVL